MKNKRRKFRWAAYEKAITRRLEMAKNAPTKEDYDFNMSMAQSLLKAGIDQVKL